VSLSQVNDYRQFAEGTAPEAAPRRLVEMPASVS
jgi:hypothetical protein